MEQYCFVGAESEIGGVAKLSRIGQTIALSDDAARNAIVGGCAIIPQESFNEIGFTQEELKKYGTQSGRIDAPEDFNAKVALGLELFHRIRGEFGE